MLNPLYVGCGWWRRWDDDDDNDNNRRIHIILKSLYVCASQCHHFNFSFKIMKRICCYLFYFFIHENLFWRTFLIELTLSTNWAWTISTLKNRNIAAISIQENYEFNVKRAHATHFSDINWISFSFDMHFFMVNNFNSELNNWI